MGYGIYKGSYFHAALTFAILFLVGQILGAQTIRYKVVPLTSPYNPAGTVFASKLNRWGSVALTDSLSGSGRAFVWKGGRPIALSLFGGNCGTAYGINGPGHIVGGACLPGEDLPHAYLYRNQQTIDLGTFGGVSSYAVGVNRSDQVVGNYTLDDGSVQSFFWERKHVVGLGTLGGSTTLPYNLNNWGVVTGRSDISNDLDPVFNIPHFHGFQWVGGVLTDFGSIFGSDFSIGDGLNDLGVIAGSADVAGDTAAHAIVWNNGTVQDLSPFDNIAAWAAGINNLGDVVGSWGSVASFHTLGPPVQVMVCPCHAILWQNGQKMVLNDLVPAEWNLFLGLAINDHGEILSYGQFNGGPQFTVVLLKPLPVAEQTTRSQSTQAGPTSTAAGPRYLGRDRQGRIFLGQ